MTADLRLSAVALMPLNAAAKRIEAIADRLSQIARTTFPVGQAQIAAEAKFDYLSAGVNARDGSFYRIVAHEVETQRAAFDDKLEQEATSLVNELPNQFALVRAKYEELRPRRDVSTPAAVMLSQERWAAQVALLNAGRYLPELIKQADAHTLFAIEAFAPEWQRAQSSKRSESAEEIAAAEKAITVAVDARLAELSPPELRAMLRTVQRATGFHEVAWTFAQHLARRFGDFANANPMEASIAVAYIRREYGIDPNPSEVLAASNEVASREASSKFRVAQQWAARVAG
jgi:hypothetical protein